MKRLYFSILINIVFCISLLAQNEGLEVIGVVKDNQKPKSNVRLSFYNKTDSTLLYEIKTDANGKFRQLLEFDKDILLIVSEQDYLALKFEFNTNLTEPKLRNKKYKFTMTIDLWHKFENVDYDIFNNPIAIIKYDYYEKEFLLDFDYFDKVYNKFMSKIRQTNYYAKQESMYNKQIRIADSLFRENKLTEAREFYHKAVSLRPAESYAIAQIEKINEKLVKHKTEENYKNTLRQADSALKIGNVELAKNLYIKAVEINPEENIAIEQLLAIDIQERKQKEFEKILALAETAYSNNVLSQALAHFERLQELKPNNPYVLQKINEITEKITIEKKKEAYNTAIEKGNAALNTLSYNIALAYFEEAAKIFPEQTLPIQKINEIKKIIEKEDIDKRYEKAILDGKEALEKKQYEKALAFYNEALSLKPDENEVKTKVKEIASIIAKEQQHDAYTKAIFNADKAFELKMYEDALIFYKEALTIKPDEEYPKQKINELMSFSEQKKKREEYENLISEGNKFMEYKSYELARNKFQTALKLYPDEKYPIEKINEINKILSDRLKREEYAKAIENGDQFFNNQSYTEALTYYQKALNLFPDEKYPKDKITEITNILDSRKKQANYEQIIYAADDYFNQKKYNLALEQYNKALEIFPEEKYPKLKISEIDSILVLQRKKQEFEHFISQGDKHLKEGEYDMALEMYKKAEELFSVNEIVDKKIAEVNNLIAQRDKKKFAQKLLSEADNLYQQKDFIKAEQLYIQAYEYIPDNLVVKEKINEISDKKRKYNDLIAKANTLYTEGKFEEAILNYEKATEFLPKEKLPLMKMNEIKQKQKEFESLIKKAEIAVNDSSFLLSVSLLKKAMKIKPNEQFLKDKLSEINKKISEIKKSQQSVSIVNLKVNKDVIKRGQTKNYTFDAIDLEDKQKSSILIKIRNLTPEKSFDIILNYGINGQKYGGFYVTIAKTEEVKEYLIPASSQPLWLSFDNNWFSLYSSTGDIEVHSIKIIQN